MGTFELICFLLLANNSDSRTRCSARAFRRAGAHVPRGSCPASQAHTLCPRRLRRDGVRQSTFRHRQRNRAPAQSFSSRREECVARIYPLSSPVDARRYSRIDIHSYVYSFMVLRNSTSYKMHSNSFSIISRTPVLKMLPPSQQTAPI